VAITEINQNSLNEFADSIPEKAHIDRALIIESGLMKLERFSLEKCIHCIYEGFASKPSVF